MLSIPATKAFEIGSGFRGTEVPGSKHNDPFIRGEDGRLRTATNWSGGVQGGITNGENIYFRYLSVGWRDACSLLGSLPLLGLGLSPQPPSLNLKRLHNMMVLPERWQREVDMTHVLSLVPSQL